MHGHTETVLQGNSMYIMTQAPEKGEESSMPYGLCEANTYTEVTTVSKGVAVVIKNQMAVLITIGKGIKITGVVAANRVPPVEVMPGTLEKLDKIQGIQQTQMTIGQRKEMLLQQLDLSGLEEWSGVNCTSAHSLLTILQCLLARTWRVGMHEPSKTGNPGC